MTTLLAPRDDLIRGVTEIRAEGDGNTMVGYPIVFDTWTEINSWEGEFLERVHPNAVNRTIKQRGDQVKVQFDHGMHPVIGSLPLGKPETMRADDLGLWTETPLSRAEDVQTLIKPRLQEGSIDGMSFRFSVLDENWEEEPGESDHNPRGLPERTIRELRLFEFGPVTWPAYEATQVGIRSQAAFAAWLAQDHEDRHKILRQFEIEPRREIIRVRSGDVVIDTPDDETDVREDVAEDDSPSPDGHGEQHEDSPAERHESTDDDSPAESHESTSDDEAERIAADDKARDRRKVMAEVKAALDRKPLA